MDAFDIELDNLDYFYMDNLPDTNLSPPTVKRMIPLPVIGVEDSDPILTPGNRDSMASDEGVVNPAFDSLDRLGVGGPAWSETSSDNNNRDDPSANRKRESYGVTDSLPRFPKKMNDKSFIAPDLEREGKTSTLKSWDVFRVVNRSKQRGVDDELLSKLLAIETLHTAGITLFTFYVLPSMDALRGLALTFGVGCVPALLKMFDTQREEGRKFYVFIADIVALVAQISILILWPVRDFVVNEKSELTWTIPVSLLLISIGWWENYINKFTAMGKLGARLKEFKRRVRRMRTKIYMIASLWKIILTLILMSVMVTAGSRSCLKVLYGDQDFATDCPHLIHPSGDNVASAEMETNPFYVAVIQVVACLLCYQFSKTACKVMLQVVSVSLPLMLAAPIIGGLFIASCESWYTDSMKAFMPDYLYWTCDINGISRGYLGTLYEDYLLPVALVWWLSFMWVTFHIWMPRVERLVQTEHLFVQPLYCGVMLEQSLMLNRRRDDRDRARRYSDKEQKRKGNTTFSMLDGGFPSQLPATPRDPVRKEPAPMIYVCATMWHETEKEMLQFLTSLFRLDDDQCARKNAQKFFDVVDPDFYEFEAHIFFDDAYEPHDVDAEDYNVNSFVHQLVGIVDKAASKVHRVPMRLAPPTRYPTPYGGRLEWAMLGGNKMIVHLKDKSKIRIKKRWSQVMYMYYLLGHRLVGQNLDARRKQTLADNTYVLALDGDVDFRPSAVQVLVDRLKRNEKVGAACGRIHPIGMGPMVWYQKFEYAISHWLQKATEHMIGCVLCSPGCFSLFRASSLMDDNVMGKYASLSSQARHYVQYDQGEDRWLCTLLLQQGYRIEYCANADALTYCPEGFVEFYNQRRRWSPSTMANIMDLLGDWRNIVKINENMSLLYMAYQLLLFCSSLLTPATVFLLITGALNTAFPAFDVINSLVCNAVPVGLFMAACFFCESKWQMMLAQVLSLVYALLMMVVVVGLGLNMILEGLCSPTAIFLFFLLGVFIISAIMHPQEFTNLLHGALYFLSVPSMSMLLMIYSICNMHVVSWGTRESATATDPNAKAAPQKKPDSKLQALLARFNTSGADDLDSDYGFSFGNLFRCLCCPKPRPDTSEAKFEMVLERLENIERAVTSGNQESQAATGRSIERCMSSDEGVSVTFETINEGEGVRRRSTPRGEDEKEEEGLAEAINPVYKPTVFPSPPTTTTSSENSPVWLDDDGLGQGRTRYLGNDEKSFWKDLIGKYLTPLEKNEAQQVRVQNDLLELRNKMALMFFMLNGLFIIIVFTLQYTNAIKMGNGISIPLPCTATNGNQLTLEPISLLFMLVYGIALVIQFVSMFFHRLGTALHIMSSTDINCMKPNTRELNAMDIAGKIALVKEMQQMDDDDDKMSVTTTSSSGFDDDSSITQDDSPKLKRRKTVIRITQRRKHKQQAGGEIPVAAGDNLGTKFVKNFMDLANDLRKERISETSNHSHDKFGTRKGSSSTKRKSRKTIRAMTSIQQDRDAVLHKADAIETKLQKIQKRNGGAEASTGKVDSWLHLVRDVLTQSRISLNTIGEEEKRSSLPWRNRLSRATSVEGVPREETKGKGMPKRASFGGSTPLNIIADNDEEEDMLMLKSKAKNATDRHTVTIDDVAYGKVKVDLRPRSNIVTRAVNKDNDMKLNRLSEPAKTHVGASPRISEEDARANSIESESDMSEPEASDTGSNSGAPSVAFNNKPEYIENFREAGSVSVPAPDDVFIVDS